MNSLLDVLFVFLDVFREKRNNLGGITLKGISVICLVYNEEKRIQRFINSFRNYDEIIVLDKGSTDNTVEIATKNGVNVITVPYTDKGTVWKHGVDIAKFDWVFLLTASDVVHPKLTKQIYKFINSDEANNYTNANIPTTMHILGMSQSNLVTDWQYRNTFFKKNNMYFEDKIHEEFLTEPDIRYSFPHDRMIAIHHLCYESLEQCYERQLRYAKEEIHKDMTYKKAFKAIFSEIKRGIRVKVWKAGWHGIGSVLFMVGYRIQIFLRLLEAENGDIAAKYNQFALELEAESNKIELSCNGEKNNDK